mmetsp:Transcript_9096/g.14770  ORF Transcript_9096/g.14770 Transcript_9096/m.14770 type:complete len:136 (+) Transcript_9096:48-455(+)
MQFASCVVAVLLASGSASVVQKTNTTIPVTEKVSIEGTEVFSQSAGHQLLNTCTSFAPSFVKDETKPSITVCGTMTKVTVYLRNECESYSSYQLDIGTCDTTAPSTTCVTQSPATTQWLMTAQSYEIKQCATGTQ